MKSEQERHEELVSQQVQSAVAPLVAMVNTLNHEVRELKTEVRAINDLVIGAKFLGMTGKVVISIGVIIGMFWGAFKILEKNS